MIPISAPPMVVLSPMDFFITSRFAIWKLEAMAISAILPILEFVFLKTKFSAVGLELSIEIWSILF